MPKRNVNSRFTIAKSSSSACCMAILFIEGTEWNHAAFDQAWQSQETLRFSPFA